MHTYRVWFDHDTAALFNARDEREARAIAHATYPHEHIVRVEQLN